MTTVYLDIDQVPAQLRQGYAGRKFQAKVCEEVTIPMDAGLWSGGSRDTYRVVRFEDGATIEPMRNQAPWDKSRQDIPVKLAPGIAVIEHTIFCGKDLGLTFYVHPENARKLLPAPVELTALEKLVLEYTAHRKSSYMGRDRYQMAVEDARYGYGENREKLVPSRPEWDAAKQSLIARGFLNKAGAITTAGRNAI
jgi:hypothetical protein